MRYGLFQDGGTNGSPMRQPKGVEDNPYDNSVPHVAQQSRSGICRLDAQKRSHTIRVNLSEQLRRRVLKPIIRGDAVGFDMEFERAVEVGQLHEGGVVVRCRWREAIGWRDVAKQLQEVPVE